MERKKLCYRKLRDIVVEDQSSAIIMKSHIKPFIIAFLTACSIAAVTVYFIYEDLKSDFNQRIITEKINLEAQKDSEETAEEDLVPENCAKAYQEGFMDCLRDISPDTYSAFLHSFIDYGAKPLTNAEYQTLAESYQLDADEVEFLKRITHSAESTE